MQTVDENHEDLWSDLESEFETQEAQPLALNLPDPPSRQRTMGVTNPESLFSGYYPVLLVCFIAGMAGVADWEHGLLVSATCFAAFLLAAVFAPTFRGARRGWGYYALTALLIGGAAEVSVAVSELGVSMVLPHFAPSMFAFSLQRQIESFYQLDHWILYLLLGVGIAKLTFRLRKRFPWMDGPSTGPLHKILVATLLTVPLLLPLGCFIVGFSQANRTEWYLSTLQSNPDTLRIKQLYPSKAEVWTRLYLDWLRSTPNSGGASREVFQETTVAELHRVERKYLELIRAQGPKRGWSSWQRTSIQDLLLVRKEDLAQPFEVAVSLIDYSMLDHFYAESNPRIGQQWLFFLETLETQNPSATEAREILTKLKRYDQTSRSVIAELDSYVLASAALHTPYSGEKKPEPMTLFGVPFNHSPSQLFFLYWTDYVTRDWLEFRENLLGLDAEQQISLVRQQESSESWMLQRMSLRTFDFELSRLWQAAAVMTASRLYQLEHGAWPSQARDLDPFLWFEPEFRLAQIPDGLQIQAIGSDQNWTLK